MEVDAGMRTYDDEDEEDLFDEEVSGNVQRQLCPCC